MPVKLPWKRILIVAILYLAILATIVAIAHHRFKGKDPDRAHPNLSY